MCDERVRLLEDAIVRWSLCRCLDGGVFRQSGFHESTRIRNHVLQDEIVNFMSDLSDPLRLLHRGARSLVLEKEGSEDGLDEEGARNVSRCLDFALPILHYPIGMIRDVVARVSLRDDI